MGGWADVLFMAVILTILGYLAIRVARFMQGAGDDQG